MRGYRWADDPKAIEELKRKAPEVVARGVDLRRLPRVVDHRWRVAAIPAVEKVVALEREPAELNRRAPTPRAGRPGSDAATQMGPKVASMLA